MVVWPMSWICTDTFGGHLIDGRGCKKDWTTVHREIFKEIDSGIILVLHETHSAVVALAWTKLLWFESRLKLLVRFSLFYWLITMKGSRLGITLWWISVLLASLNWLRTKSNILTVVKLLRLIPKVLWALQFIRYLLCVWCGYGSWNVERSSEWRK